MLDAFERVGEYDAAVAEADLEDWTMLFGQARSDFGMVLTKLEEISEERDAWDFGEVLDLGMISVVEVLDDEEANGEDGEGD